MVFNSKWEGIKSRGEGERKENIFLFTVSHVTQNDTALQIENGNIASSHFKCNDSCLVYNAWHV